MSTTVEKPTCTAVKANGERCRQTLALDKNGLCAFHSGATDLRKAGRLGGLKQKGTSGRKRGGFREHLLSKIAPSSVAMAIESGLASPKESDRLAAARLLLAEVAEPAQPAVVVPPARMPGGEDRSASLVDVAKVLIECGALDAALAEIACEKLGGEVG